MEKNLGDYRKNKKSYTPEAITSALAVITLSLAISKDMLSSHDSSDTYIVDPPAIEVAARNLAEQAFLFDFTTLKHQP